ncbi:hypothetical protein TNCV_4998261 [Trichonephila clavipes]|nr:hypothetical protein TNCV_4998261 [Trichonephila clavipes]
MKSSGSLEPVKLGFEKLESGQHKEQDSSRQESKYDVDSKTVSFGKQSDNNNLKQALCGCFVCMWVMVFIRCQQNTVRPDESGIKIGCKGISTSPNSVESGTYFGMARKEVSRSVKIILQTRGLDGISVGGRTYLHSIRNGNVMAQR